MNKVYSISITEKRKRSQHKCEKKMVFMNKNLKKNGMSDTK